MWKHHDSPIASSSLSRKPMHMPHSNVWVMSHIDVSCHIWMSHVMYEWVVSRMNESCHVWRSHVHMKESCHLWMSRVTYEWVMTSIAAWSLSRKPMHMRHLNVWVMFHMNASCHTWTHVTSPLDESCHVTFGWVMSCHLWMSHVTSPLDESCRVWMSHRNESRHYGMTCFYVTFTHELSHVTYGSKRCAQKAHSLHIATFCNGRPICNILQQTATNCDKLQQTATYCNTLPHKCY